MHGNAAGGISLTGYRITWIVFLAVPVALALLVGELLIFHLVLQYRGMSTYDYILAQREKHSGHSGQRHMKPATQEQTPEAGLIAANGSALEPDGFDLDQTDQEPSQGLHRKIRLSPCAAMSFPEEDADSKAAGEKMSRPESVVSMNSLLVAGTHSEVRNGPCCLARCHTRCVCKAHAAFV